MSILLMTYHDKCLSWGSWGIQSQPHTGWHGAIFSRDKIFRQQQVQTRPEAYPLSYPMETSSFPGIKALEHEADHFHLPFLFCNLTEHLFALLLDWAKWNICRHSFPHHIHLQGNRKKKAIQGHMCIWPMGHAQNPALRTHITVHNAQIQKYVVR